MFNHRNAFEALRKSAKQLNDNCCPIGHNYILDEIEKYIQHLEHTVQKLDSDLIECRAKSDEWEKRAYDAEYDRDQNEDELHKTYQLVRPEDM